MIRRGVIPMMQQQPSSVVPTLTSLQARPPCPLKNSAICGVRDQIQPAF